MRFLALASPVALLAFPGCSGKDSGNDSVPVSDTDTDTDADTDADSDADTDTDPVDTAAELDAAREAFAADLTATWKTPCTVVLQESGDPGYLIIELMFGGNGAAGSFSTTVYKEEGCTTKLANFRGTTTIDIGDPLSDVAVYTWETNTHNVALYATPYVEEAAAGLETAGCGSASWTVNVEQDISTTGCGSYKSVASCPTTYDLAQLTGDTTAGYNILYTGTRTADTCDEANRPTTSNASAEQPWGYERQ